MSHPTHTISFYLGTSAPIGAIRFKEVAITKEGINLHYSFKIANQYYFERNLYNETQIRKCFIPGADHGDVFHLGRVGQ
jgi:hypothetical protein